MTYVYKNWGFFVIFTGIAAALTVTAIFLIPWIAVIITAVWAYLLWRFSAVKYRSNESELEIQSGIFVKTVRRVDLSEILWKSRVSVGNAVITVLHTSAGRVVLFADL